MHVQLIERASGKLLGDAFCNGNNKHASPPSRDGLLANNAQLLKDAVASHAWFCVHALAKDQFLLPDEAVSATPTEFADPLATFAANPANAQYTPQKAETNGKKK